MTVVSEAYKTIGRIRFFDTDLELKTQARRDKVIFFLSIHNFHLEKERKNKIIFNVCWTHKVFGARGKRPSRHRIQVRRVTLLILFYIDFRRGVVISRPKTTRVLEIRHCFERMSFNVKKNNNNKVTPAVYPKRVLRRHSFHVRVRFSGERHEAADELVQAVAADDRDDQWDVPRRWPSGGGRVVAAVTAQNHNVRQTGRGGRRGKRVGRRHADQQRPDDRDADGSKLKKNTRPHNTDICICNIFSVPMLVRAPAAVRETPRTEVFRGWRGMTEDEAGAGGEGRCPRETHVSRDGRPSFWQHFRVHICPR